jgi:transcriptional regulator
MYNLPYFKENEEQPVIEFMKQHPFVVITGVDKENKPVATHVPVLFDCRADKIFLRGHIMRQTDHHKAFENNPNVLAIFNGPQVYVSASWYSDKLQGSTWNYMTVHAKGIMRFLDEAELVNLLRDLTAYFENDVNSPSLYDNLPGTYIQRMIKAIVAFEIEVADIDNVFKLSQNRDQKSYEAIINKLSLLGSDGKAIADEMEKRSSQLFKTEKA